MPNPIFFGRIDHGNLIHYNPELWGIRKSKLEGKEVTYTLDKRVYKRSKSQNDYYWPMCVRLIAEHVGMAEKDAHEDLLTMFASTVKRIELKDGSIHEFTVKERTHDMSMERMLKFTEDVKIWAAQFLGIYIPDPGELL